MADYNIGVTEEIEIDEVTLNQTFPILLNVYDESTVSESSEFFLLTINVSDDISTSEYTKEDLWWAEPDAENISVAESVSIETTYNISVNDTVSAAESVSVGFIEILWIKDIYETVTASEYIYQFAPDQLFIDKSEEVSVVEFGSADIFPQPRHATPAWLAAVNAQANHPVYLIHMDIEDPVYISTGFNVINYGGNVYKPSNGFVQITDIEEDAELGVNSITIGLAGANQNLISEFLNKEYIDRDCYVWLAFLDSDDVLIDDPVIFFTGHIDQPTMVEDTNGLVSVGVSIANQWVDFERKPGRYTNDVCQQSWYPGDRGLEFCFQVQPDFQWRD